jgi:hypothetical protein
VHRLFVVLALLSVAACSSNGDEADRRTREFQLRAVEQLVDNFRGTDVDCEEPTSVEPGTEFGCHAHIGDQTLEFTARIGPDEEISLTID